MGLNLGMGLGIAQDNVIGPFGPELVLNGTFDDGTTDWGTVGSTSLSVTSGIMRVASTVTTSNARCVNQAAIATVIGKDYTVSIDYVGGTSVGERILIGTIKNGNQYASQTDLSVNTYTFNFTATGTSLFITFGCTTAASGEYSEWDNVTAKEVLP